MTLLLSATVDLAAALLDTSEAAAVFDAGQKLAICFAGALPSSSTALSARRKQCCSESGGPSASTARAGWQRERAQAQVAVPDVTIGDFSLAKLC